MLFTVTLAYLPGVSLLEFLVIGIVAGLLLDVCLKGKGYGFLGNSLLGVIGAIVGGFVWEKPLKEHVKIDLGSATIQLITVIAALVGTFLLLLLVNTVMKNRQE